MINNGCRGAIDNALPLHVKGLGFDSRWRKPLFHFLSRFFFFFLTCFHFLTGLKYTSRLIASSLSAFISKIINPQVSHRHPLICVVTQPSPLQVAWRHKEQLLFKWLRIEVKLPRSSVVLIIARGRCVSSHLSKQIVTDALTEKAWEDTVQGLSKKQTNEEIISWTSHSGGYINNIFWLSAFIWTLWKYLRQVFTHLLRLC